MSTDATSARRIVLAARPHGEPTSENFRIEEFTLPDPGPGEVVLRTKYLSLDPYMRGRMNDGPSYAAPVQIDAPMGAATVSEVVRSEDASLAPGDVVLGYGGWQDHSVERAKFLRKLDPSGPPASTALGVLGMPGFTAWSGLNLLGKPKAGETVAVAAAAGPVGSMVAQLAKLQDCHAVAIAGGPDKCAWIRDECGVTALDYRADDFAEQFAAATPDGVDVYFENVGGAVFDVVFRRMNTYGRIPLCGLVSGYNVTELPPGPNRVPSLMAQILTKSLTVRGFIQSEFEAELPRFLAEVSPLVASGAIAYREDVADGLDSAPEAFIGMLNGKNFGKQLVRVS